jgi:two-component system sensor histidine kinase MtrB
LILLIGAVSFYVTGRIVSPVRKAAEVSSQLAAGDLEPRLEVDGNDIIAALGASFNTMADSMKGKIDELSKLSQMQQRFVSDVSHELRTPLTTIKLSAELLQARRDELSPSALRNLDKLTGQITRFEDLLADLLEISRFDAKSVNADFEVEDLNGVVGLALAHIQPLADAKGSVLQVNIPNGPVEAEFDPRRIERVLRNLLSNALEHGEGKPVSVSVAQNETAVAVTVTDQGVGMTQTQVSRVFDRFWRADPARQRTTGGTGLGLSIAQADTSLHNGWLQVVSKPNKGTTFRLTLPRRQSVLFTQSPLPLAVPDEKA